MSNIKSQLSIAAVSTYYNLLCKPRILRRIRRQERVNVVFFVVNVAMWKYDGFFRLLQQDPRFHPMVVAFLYPGDKEEDRREEQERMRAYFSDKGYPFYASYCFESGEFLDIKSLQPDIVFYAQPYDDGYAPFRIRALMNRCLFAYIPYCYNMEDKPDFFNRLLHSVAWRLFLPTEHHAAMVALHAFSHGRNVVVSGYPMTDRFLSAETSGESPGKEKDPGLKRVVWAPHHSVVKGELLEQSSFLELAQGMLELARKYQGKIQFVLKPHPRLRPKLHRLPAWGWERTEAYFKAWEALPNAALSQGDYVRIFQESDALLHDCSSFMGEYLFFGKPVSFLADKAVVSTYLNDFGKACLSCHYQTTTIDAIDAFLTEVVLEGNDPMKPAREAFRKQLTGGEDRSVAQRLYDDFTSALTTPS